MKDEIVTYETSLLAKDKGFDVYTELTYCNDYTTVDTVSKNISVIDKYLIDVDDVKYDKYSTEDYIKLLKDNQVKPVCYAPTQSLLQRWLREVNHLFIEVYITNNHIEGIQGFEFLILKPKGMVISHLKSEGGFSTYEAALEAGLQQALKLIDNGKQ